MSGTKITWQDGSYRVPEDPIIPFIEGDGIGRDIWRASHRVLDAAVEKAYGGRKKISWFEVFAGQAAKDEFDEWLPNDKYAQAIRLQNAVQSCLDGESPLSCVEGKQLQFDYVYVAREGMLRTFCRATMPIRRGDALIADLMQDSRFRTVYEGEAVEIFSFQR